MSVTTKRAEREHFTIATSDRDARVQRMTRCQALVESVRMVEGGKAAWLVSNEHAAILLDLLMKEIHSLAAGLEKENKQED